MPTPSDFFNEQRNASKIKTAIVVKYFKPWLEIMTKRNPKVGYVDLFSGPGKYVSDADEEVSSTPLLILDLVAQHPALTSKLHLRFNDANAEHASCLREAMSMHPAWPLVEQRVSISNERITAEQLKSWVLSYPALYFLDPFGYGGFTFDDLNAIVRRHGNDVLFFFNFNRFNLELNHKNDKIKRQPEILLGGQSYHDLQDKLTGVDTSAERQQVITDHLWTQLERGGEPHHFVVPFEFKFKDRDRTSHYLVFVSKNRYARKIIREVMAGLRSNRAGGNFEYNPHEQGGTLFDPHFSLGEDLRRMFTGKTLTVEKIIAEHDLAFPRSPYIEKDYKDALKQLRSTDHLSVIKADGKAVPLTQMPPTALVTFK